MLTQAQLHQRHRNDKPAAPTRIDWNTARFVEEGIVMQAIHGTGHAAKFLKNRMVHIDVALRVLLSPEKRRDFDRRQ
ncbi:MAG: hypothetical protein JWQ23_2335 [Herminiimonas sp.]|jgi:hypothetical protein|nr:hypothetical protein [Herminiimonas sp.]